MSAKNSDNIYYLWWLTLGCVSAGLIYLLSPILTPFLLAAVIAYICNPIVTRMAAHRVPRTFGAVLVMLLLGAVLGAMLGVVIVLWKVSVSNLNSKVMVSPILRPTNYLTAGR